MMANDVLATVLHLNLAAALAILAILAVRPLARRTLGPEIAYNLWLCVPVAALAALIPAPAATRIIPPGVGPHFDPVYLASVSVAQAPAAPFLAIWLIGAAVALGALVIGQLNFLDLARRGLAGPAVAG